MIESMGKRILFVPHARLSGIWITNSKFALIPSNKFAPFTEHIILKANLVTTRTANQGMGEKLSAETIRAHPEIRIANSNQIRPCAKKSFNRVDTIM